MYYNLQGANSAFLVDTLDVPNSLCPYLRAPKLGDRAGQAAAIQTSKFRVSQVKHKARYGEKSV